MCGLHFPICCQLASGCVPLLKRNVFISEMGVSRRGEWRFLTGYYQQANTHLLPFFLVVSLGIAGKGLPSASPCRLAGFLKASVVVLSLSNTVICVAFFWT